MLSIGYQLRGWTNFNPGFRSYPKDPVWVKRIPDEQDRSSDYLIWLRTLSIFRNVSLLPKDECYSLFHRFIPVFPFPGEVSGNFQRICCLYRVTRFTEVRFLWAAAAVSRRLDSKPRLPCFFQIWSQTCFSFPSRDIPNILAFRCRSLIHGSLCTNSYAPFAMSTFLTVRTAMIHSANI